MIAGKSCDLRVLDKLIMLSWDFCLSGRTKIADRPGDFFFLVTDWTIRDPIMLLDPETSREWHSYRMTRIFEYKHLERSNQEIEESLIRRIEGGDIV